MELTRQNTVGEMLFLWILFGMSVAIIIFTCVGLYSYFWSTPAYKVEIQILQERNKNLQHEIEYLKSRLDNCDTALQFENFFTLIATPNQMLMAQSIDELIKSKKEFYLGVRQ